MVSLNLGVRLPHPVLPTPSIPSILKTLIGASKGYFTVQNSLEVSTYKVSIRQMEPCREKTGFLHKRKQRRRSASR